MRVFYLTILMLFSTQLLRGQINYNKVSEELLQAIIDNQATQDYQTILNNVSVNDLQKYLDTDQKKIAFWVNIYNAYIQIILKPDPKQYEDKRKFFKVKQIPIAGMKLSFADIEHGIIRSSQNEYFLGYIPKLFPPDYEKRLRVDKVDFRIHFALNCGAMDCPPVAVYTPENLEYELNYMSKRYLKSYSEVNDDAKEVKTAQLFAWFRGDFGGSEGIRQILVDYEIIPLKPRYRLYQKKYNWTLKLDNFVDIP